MPVSDDEIERIISIVQSHCASSGGCTVFVNEETRLSVVMGEEEICYIGQEEGANPDTIRQKIRDAAP